MELLGVFQSVARAASAADRLVEAGVDESRVTSLTSVPYPEGVLCRQQQRSWFHWLALAGGLGGAVLGFALAVGTAWLYPVQTGDKPIIALFPTGIITYEFTMLFAIVGTMVGMFWEMKLPAVDERLYDPEIADGLIGICVSLNGAVGKDEAVEILREAGALRVHSSEEH
ncbi:MAG: DUF3341 domain-containing protein [Desulfuromonadales bacterium]|nr:DUF3341 domain-containing protein [Desulfuromonadales bacterium]NIR33751.1 DUF3341 domain-containing protein [Desulfuromonadales bacterium]NIS43747.1 DUF3341 domain-containing protein [Desulfuromonadales bacterium]